ncbi:phosphatase PAP2 family protein [Inhella gelatinilytica]|uniref:Phosphatase PAP2 family protein n=1 Tax=Inhella gelatinilytica TaxID=2795030 RepID=A0A931ISE9_9BURK|nr:phosphatase PAP2 family protein [Inhella gelatinilytica]MBH9551827.1 phosphatase PAP2 family protein [Inhella gelatinilytica]
MNDLDRSLPVIRAWAQALLVCALLLKVAQWVVFGVNSLVDLGDFDAERWIVHFGTVFVFPVLFLLIAGWLPFSRRLLIGLVVAGLPVVALLFIFGSGRYIGFLAYQFALLPLIYFLLARAIWAWWESRRTVSALPGWLIAFFWLTVLIKSFDTVALAWLKLSGVLFPATYDVHLYKLELAYDNLAARVAAVHLSLPVWMRESTVFIYAVLNSLFLPLLALLHRERKATPLHGWVMLLTPFLVAWCCYAWLPASGPSYLFQMKYPVGVPSPADVTAALSTVIPAPRNAMPSMHFSGAIFVFMIAAALRRKGFMLPATVLVLGTAWATLALGEHYVIDLVVALPFAPALAILLMRAPLWRVAPRWQKGVVWSAGATFVVWMLLLRLAPAWLQANLGWVQVFSVWSVGVGLYLMGLHVTKVWSEASTQEALLAPSLHVKAFTPPHFLPHELQGKKWLVGIFFFSGFAGLVYEVVYAKALGVTFGGTALAANTVLMTYMGGMALGAWLGGGLAARSRQPLMLYAFFEAAIGIYAAVTPQLFHGVQQIYVALALDAAPDAGWLTALRMGLGAAVLGVPTVLMGATLPLVFQCLRGMGIPTGRAIAPLYAANVLGAAVGALVAGYALLPAVGRTGSTLIAAVLSLMVALYVIDKIKRGVLEAPVGAQESGLRPGSQGAPALTVGPREGLSALAVLTIGGVVTLALEVVFMHLLAVVAGNSVYAFGLMLSTFLLGLGLGSTVGEGLMRRWSRSTLVLTAQCGIALCIFLTAFVWDGLASYMGSFGPAQQWVWLGFGARELVRALVCTLAMLPPAFFIGLSYPAAMGLAADWLAQRRYAGEAVRGVGLASALNTMGNIGGVLLAGFWWLPEFGSRNVLLGLAVTAVVLAGLVAWSAQTTEPRRVHRRWLPVGAAAGLLTFFPAHWNHTALSTGGNVYFQTQRWGEVIDYAESVEGGLTSVARAPDSTGGSQLTLLTNGKFQGNNAQGGEMVAQESFALIPLMHTAQRGAALVIGYGTGMTARVLQDQGFAQLEIAETSRDIVSLADRHFESINAGISRHPVVKMHYTDGRNFLLTQSKQFDLISLEISSIWFAGAANLYNREFYELANARLRPQGVLQQWVQLHHMRPLDFLHVLGSVRSVFKYVWVYVSGGQGILVASNDDAAFINEKALDKLMKGHTISAMNLSDLPRKLVASPGRVDAIIRRLDPELNNLVSTDNNLYLEYSTPKGNAVREDTIGQILEMLTKR